ncbi:hypothetical protein MIND_00634300 [Mycena indigotica]|uniref:LysM domain-containing protein n=1 Tax=Mycena indigotica TaxID=2126181 RepID=A0A8H6SU89_9AGAR|nr:uncharacterized protein MIND_00634300 [Mycena indigotica]KAF7304030.1 hypothetical protein MIND_00634300 [Mycena indigotica]
MRRLIAVFFMLVHVPGLQADKPVAAKIHDVNIAHGKAFQNQRVQDLAAAAVSSSTAHPSTVAASSSHPITSPAPKSSSSSIRSSLSSKLSASSVSGTVGLPAATGAVSFQIYTPDELPSAPAPPSACASALTASVACNDTIQLLGGNPWFDAPSLTAMCTSTCMDSLAAYRSAVVKSCGTYLIPGPNNVSYAATLAVDTISGPYAVSCRQDSSTHAFCNTVLDSFGPTPPQGILAYPTSELCSSCMLGTLNSTLSNPITFYPDFYSELQSALKICGSAFNSYNVTSPPGSGPLFQSTGPSGGPSGSNDTIDATCALTGRNVTTTNANSTCTTIASQFSVGWYDILANNPTIQAVNCTAGVGSGTKLCLPQACTTYTPATNQTCEDIVASANKILASSNQSITTTQLISFNPTLDTGCAHVSRSWGLSLCISPHGGFPDVTAVDDGPPPVPTATAIVPPPGPTPPGTTSNCGAWYFVQPGDFCTKVALNNSITLDDLIELNPMLNPQCTNLWASTWYCVAAYPPLVGGVPPIPTGVGSFSMGTIALPSATPEPPFPYPTGYSPAPPNVANGTITTGCQSWYTVQSGDNCTSVETLFAIDDGNFTTYNEDLNNPCPKLTVGSAVCVLVTNITQTIPPVPTNAASGSGPNGCMRWYTIISGDGCASVESKFKLTQSQFFTLNPELAPSCTNLALQEAYCVKGLPSAPPTGPPADLEPGSWSNCTTYYTVQSGDNCNSIESKFNISFSDFLHWNPEVSTTCGNLALASYCVGTSGACEQKYTVVSGDSCGAIESKTGISDAALHTLNPWIDSNCANIQIGQSVCIKNSAVGPPTNLEPGSWNNCTSYYNVQSGDNCNLIESKFNISFSDVLRWNPEISSTCGNLALASYCVGVAGGCQQTYTVVSGDSCGAIESKTGVSDVSLHTLNPWINSACSNIQIGQALCVKNTNVVPVGPPANLNPGSWSNCTTYYNVQSGDNCNVIESKFKIGFSDVLRWNPEISTTCSNLNLASYCVGVAGGCAKLYTVASGDSCGGIESKTGVSDATLHAENSWINSACTNIQVGQNICV